MSNGCDGWQWLGRVPYEAGLARQREQRDRLLAGDDNAATVFLLEHEPVITIGRHGERRHVLAADDALRDRGVEVVRVDRGGDVTYHGPGQLMVYPVLRLRGRLVEFLASIASVLAEAAAELGAPGAGWVCDPAGVWIGDDKLAACGVHLHRGIVTHGFALDVSTPARAWDVIVPCGLSDRGNTSIERVRRAAGLGAAPDVADVAALVGPRLSARLAVTARV